MFRFFLIGCGIFCFNKLWLSYFDGGITPDTLRAIINQSYAFSGITPEEYEEFILFLIENDFIFHADGLYSLGLKAEDEFGRRNFMKIFLLVFCSLQLSSKLKRWQKD